MSQFINKTIGDLLDEIADKYPDNDAVVYSDRNLRLSYNQFKNRVEKLAKGLLAIGIGKGDHVGIWATNVPDWITFQFATAKIGAVLLTININYKSAELDYILKQSDSKALIITEGYRDTDFVSTVYDLVPELKTEQRGYLQSKTYPHLQSLIYLGPEKHRGFYNTNELIALAPTIADTSLTEVQKTLAVDDVVNMQYTSGTTGFPKGVMLTHYNILNNGYFIGEAMKFTDKDRLCIPVPFFHCFGCVLGVLACVTHGATMVPVESFDPLLVLATISKEKCTAVHGVPTMFIAELAHPMFNMFDLSTLRTGIMAGSPCPVKVMEEVMDKMYCKDITIAYGLTEASPVITQTKTNDSINRRTSTVGRALEGIEVKVVDSETGETLPPHKQGELCCKGYNVMKGYYSMPEATAQAIDSDGWLHSGDLAVYDDDGYYKITGRIKDMIIRGGENVYPREIEEFLYTMEDIEDVQVLGVPSVKYGEEVLALIKLKENHDIKAEDVMDYCRGKIARYKTPKYVEFIGDFLPAYPMTASGKIQKYKIREEAVKKLNLEEAAKIETA